MLVNTMLKRSEARIPGANPDPGYEAIIGTLASISEQTSAFNWSLLTKKVEIALQQGIKDYRFSPDHIRVTPAVMTGIFDALVAVQSLPEDRKIYVNNETGVITLITY